MRRLHFTERIQLAHAGSSEYKSMTVVQAIGEAWLQLTARPWSQEAEENACLQPTPIPREPLAVTNAYFMLMIELPTATPPLAMTAAYKETDATIRIRSNRYYSAEYRIAVYPTIQPQSEYEANIRYSPTFNILKVSFILTIRKGSFLRWRPRWLPRSKILQD